MTAGSDRGRDSRARPVGADGSGENGGKFCSDVTEELIEGWWVRGRDSGEAGLVRTRTPWTFETNQINAEPTLSWSSRGLPAAHGVSPLHVDFSFTGFRALQDFSF